MNNTSAASRVLVAVDGTPSSLQALRTGRLLADLFGDRLVAVTVWEPFRHGILPPDTAHPQPAAEQLVARCLLAAFPGQDTDSVQILAVEGAPAETLIELSRGDTRMLVIGSRGHAGIAAVLLGSVSTRCAAQADCPVLVVHAPVAETAADTRSDKAPAVLDESAFDRRIVVTR